MQNTSESFSKLRTETYTINGVMQPGYPSITWVPGGMTRSFTFTGFGSNPDPLKKAPVAGTYVKTLYYRPNGWWQTLERPYGPTSAYIRRTEGDTGSIAGDHLSGYNDIDTTTILSNQIMNRAYNECLDKFYEKIKQSETNIALTLGEAKETGRMFKAFRSVDNIVKAIRQSRKLLKRNPSLLLAQTHLSIKYGWQPLLNDIWNYADWTYKVFNFGIPIKARRRITFPTYDKYTPNSYDTYRVRGKRGYGCEIEVVAYVNDPDWFTASRLTSLNPAAIAWELTTLSFVVDWIYDIGGYLENLEAALGTGLSFRRGYVTRTYYHQLSENLVRDRLIRASPYWYESMDTYSFSLRAVKRRDVLTGFPFPRKPTFKLSLGSSRILSAAALSRTVLLGKVKGRDW